MKIAWIYPFDHKNGISFYSRSFTEALAEYADIASFDSADCVHGRGIFAHINAHDLVHLHYETSLYEVNGHNRFSRVSRGINRPKIVTHHEVYREFPGVFPREKIKGRGIVRVLKKFVYDTRHPAFTAYRNHLAHGFWGDVQIVHYPFQKVIMRELGIDETGIEVMPHPVMPVSVTQLPFSNLDANGGEVRLGSSGFINPNYDYEQLFAALDMLKIKWRFTWIGGLRRPEDQAILAGIQEHIARRGWEQRFIITGWVDEDTLQRRLNDLDVYLALFSNRSTSSTIIKALAASRLIVARDLELTRDLNEHGPLMLLTGKNPKDAAMCIEELAQQPALRERIIAAVELYVAGHSYGEIAKKLVSLYRRIFERAKEGTVPK
jgi:hypothetical protein